MTSDDAVTLIVELFESEKPYPYNPFYATETSGDVHCYFCGEWQINGTEPGNEIHTPDCFYKRAKPIYEAVQGKWPR